MNNLNINKHFISVLSLCFFLALAFGSGDTKNTTTDLKASVRFTGTQFVITNNDSFDYINAKIEVNDHYTITGYTLKSGEIYTVGMMQFADDEGNRFDIMKKPQRFSIWCDLPDGNKGFYYAEWK